MINESDRNCHSEIVLLCFVFGALMTLLYYQYLSGIQRYSDFIVSAILLIDGMMSASLNGLTVVPAVSIGMGAASAAKAKELISLIPLGAAEIRMEIIILLVTVPLHFVMSAYGMNNSFRLRAAMRETTDFSAAYRIFTYVIMFIGITAAALRLRYILII